MQRIIKIGGSLLLRQNLATSINQWLDTQPAKETMVIIGGGRLIDAIRELDQKHTMAAERIHWMCVDLLAATASFAADVFGWPLITTEQQWNAMIDPEHDANKAQLSGLPTVITPTVFYNQRANLADIQIPNDWRTTTDSIAALLAHLVDADELVLLKSCPIEQTMLSTELAQTGIVDESFPELSRNLKSVRIEQLR